MKSLKWPLLGVVLAVGGVVAIPVVVIAASGVSAFFSALGGGQNVVTPERTAMIGTWTNPDGARLVLYANGVCVVSGVPRQTTDGTWKTWNHLPFNGKGTWQVTPLFDDNVSTSGGIDVVVDKYDAFLSTTGDPKHPNLSVTIGDPDDLNDLTFTKQPAPAPSSPATAEH